MNSVQLLAVLGVPFMAIVAALTVAFFVADRLTDEPVTAPDDPAPTDPVDTHGRTAMAALTPDAPALDGSEAEQLARLDADPLTRRAGHAARLREAFWLTHEERDAWKKLRADLEGISQ